MKLYLIVPVVLFVFALPIGGYSETHNTTLDDDKGTVVDLTPSREGHRILSSYTGSYALLIGEGDYLNGWPDLESVPSELQEVQSLLLSKGFQVEKFLNLNARQLKDRFETFINRFGFDKNHRLLFFFSGHGYTSKDGRTGFLVPTDAPNPHTDEKGFFQKALTMDQILAWARRIKSKHALFVFDSCFSGTIFKTKSLPENPPLQIIKAARQPVRQFITAGGANDRVPANSIFTPIFVNALDLGWGDMNQDGYVTGQELGLYLWNEVSKFTNQTPQYGKIKDYDLSLGDFVFVVGDVPKPPPPDTDKELRDAPEPPIDTEEKSEKDSFIYDLLQFLTREEWLNFLTFLLVFALVYVATGRIFSTEDSENKRVKKTVRVIVSLVFALMAVTYPITPDGKTLGDILSYLSSGISIFAILVLCLYIIAGFLGYDLKDMFFPKTSYVINTLFFAGVAFVLYYLADGMGWTTYFDSEDLVALFILTLIGLVMYWVTKEPESPEDKKKRIEEEKAKEWQRAYKEAFKEALSILGDEEKAKKAADNMVGKLKE